MKGITLQVHKYPYHKFWFLRQTPVPEPIHAGVAKFCSIFRIHPQKILPTKSPSKYKSASVAWSLSSLIIVDVQHYIGI